MLYNRWANEQFLQVCARLDHEQFVRNFGSSFPTIHDTFVHLAWAEWVWVERWQGNSPNVRANPAQYPTMASIRTYLEGVAESQLRFLRNLPPGKESLRISYTNLKGERWEYNLEQMIHHVAMHSAFHRGQLATMIRQAGSVPPTTDYLVFLDKQ
jgi:uncharacterized damage-inducible protein DinB